MNIHTFFTKAKGDASPPQPQSRPIAAESLPIMSASPVVTSSVAVPVVAATSAATKAFGLSSFSHFFGAAFNDLHKVLQFIEKGAAAISTPTVQAEVEGITALVPVYGTSAVVIERAAFQALGMLLQAAHVVDTAVAANGLSIPADAATITAFKSLITDFSPELAKLGYKI